MGDVGDGWKVVLMILMNECFVIGGGGVGFDYYEMMVFVCEFELEDGFVFKNVFVCDKIVDWYVWGKGF